MSLPACPRNTFVRGLATDALSVSEDGAGKVKTVTGEDSMPLGSIPGRFVLMEITR